jgi:hypothetical protein
MNIILITTLCAESCYSKKIGTEQWLKKCQKGNLGSFDLHDTKKLAI